MSAPAAATPDVHTSRHRNRAMFGAMAVLGSCTAVQGSAALSVPLFDDLGSPAVAAWRQLIGGILLLLVFRPTLRHRPPSTWLLIGGLGAAMASMNVLFYATVERLPLGVAASLLYLGPFVLSALAIRSPRRLVWPLAALVGVLLITRPDQASAATVFGIMMGVLAATALAGYTLLSQRLGARAGFGELALAVGFSGLLLTPIALTHVPSGSAGTWWTLVTIGVVGVGLAFTLDFVALRLAGTALVATLFALDPAVGALIGGVVLGEHLLATTFVGIGLVVLAGVGLTRTTDRAPPDSSTPP